MVIEHTYKLQPGLQYLLPYLHDVPQIEHSISI